VDQIQKKLNKVNGKLSKNSCDLIRRRLDTINNILSRIEIQWCQDPDKRRQDVHIKEREDEEKGKEEEETEEEEGEEEDEVEEQEEEEDHEEEEEEEDEEEEEEQEEEEDVDHEHMKDKHDTIDTNTVRLRQFQDFAKASQSAFTGHLLQAWQSFKVDQDVE